MQIWKDAMDLAQEVYEITENLPKKETYGIISQMTRAAVSVPSNIAEGSGRTDKDFSHFLSIAIGSLFELNTQIMLSERIGYIDNNQTLISGTIGLQITVYYNYYDHSYIIFHRFFAFVKFVGLNNLFYF